jgi:hypothetical protein
MLEIRICAGAVEGRHAVSRAFRWRKLTARYSLTVHRSSLITTRSGMVAKRECFVRRGGSKRANAKSLENKLLAHAGRVTRFRQ